MTKIIVIADSGGIYDALHKAGVLPVDPTMVRRVVIDLKVREAARIYYETFADSQLIDVILAGGLRLTGAGRG